MKTGVEKQQPINIAKLAAKVPEPSRSSQFTLYNTVLP